ncbi:MAG: isocitrate dehydrogenase (NAD(+)) [Myxococcales bacterium]|nr:isocitrate dehydrogenase (NAD(+)) [Myxococcales bacterium]
MSDARRTVTLMSGDGIGPEVMEATRAILEAARCPLDYEYQEAGAGASSRFGTNLPDVTVESCLRNGVGLKGPTATGIGGGQQSANVALRKRLDLYASLRPVKSIPGVKTRYEDVDLVVVRENTEDLYAGLEHIVVPGVVESLKIITEKASTRICRFAFEYARARGRKKVSAVHKANIMKLSDGLFLDCFRAVSREFPDIQGEEVIVDALCMQLVRWPEKFDVMVMENLYGDIVSDLCAGLVGGLGLVPGANLGEKTAVFEAVHGTAPDIAGSGLANPTALLMSAVMMLDYLKLTEHSRRIEQALLAVYAEGKVKTKDLGGSAKTTDFTRAVIDAMK